MSHSEPAIAITGLVRRYGKHDAVNGLDLTVSPGRCYGLFGRNGAGKTTTIKCLLTPLRPDAGPGELGGEQGLAPGPPRRRQPPSAEPTGPVGHVAGRLQVGQAAGDLIGIQVVAGGDDIDLGQVPQPQGVEHQQRRGRDGQVAHGRTLGATTPGRRTRRLAG